MAQKISSFVCEKLDFYRRKCNFTDEELRFFNLRAQDKKMVAICIEMPVSKSKADSLSKSVKDKIAEADKYLRIVGNTVLFILCFLQVF